MIMISPFKNKIFTIAFFAGLAAYGLLILSFFLPFGARELAGERITTYKLSDIEDVGAGVYLGVMATLIVWILIPKRWAAIVGIVFSAIFLVFAIVVVKLDGDGNNLKLMAGATLLWLAPLIILISFVVRTVIHSIMKKRAGSASAE